MIQPLVGMPVAVLAVRRRMGGLVMIVVAVIVPVGMRMVHGSVLVKMKMGFRKQQRQHDEQDDGAEQSLEECRPHQRENLATKAGVMQRCAAHPSHSLMARAD